MMVGFAVVVPWTGAMVKLIGEPVPAPQINAVRFTVQTVLFAAIAIGLARRLPPAPRPLWPLLARGLFMAIGSAFLYAGYRAMPLADVAAIFFVEPLLATAFAALFLGEPVGWRRFSAVGVGLAGAVIVIGPKFDQLGWPALAPLMAAISFAVTSMFTRRFSALANAPTMQFFASAIGAALLWLGLIAAGAAGVGSLAPVAPATADWGLMLAVGLTSTFSSLMISQSFRVARVSTVAPFQYVELLVAAAVGWIVFRDAVAGHTWLGAALILGSGLFVFWRERRLAASGPRPAR